MNHLVHFHAGVRTLGFIVSVILTACHPQPAGVTSASARSTWVAEAPARGTEIHAKDGPETAQSVLPPLSAPAALDELPVPGHSSAIVSLPVGTTRPRPVIVVAHGNFDRPEWECSTWRGIVHDRAFVLCPRGRPRPDGPRGDLQRFTYSNASSLSLEIEAALAALRAQRGEYVDPGPVVYAGFSLGAILGPEAIRRGQTPASAAVMIEGSHEQWNQRTMRAFVARGGRRVLFACGSGWCDRASRTLVQRFRAAGVEARYTTAAGAGHQYGGPVAERIASEIDWLFGDDPRFERGLDLPASP